ncbi:MAG: ABC transporter permease [Chloroflexota bacterium]|nr:ABC transporter permease [Chloroflexota bacterium]MDQ5866899.1 ABC transporter permease [Chloroflexota bacterium]
MIRHSWRRLTNQNRIPFALLLLAVVLLINFILQPNLLEPATMNSSMRIFLPLILVAVGQTIVILAGGIDISAGAIVSITNAILATQIGTRGDTGTAMLMMLAVLFVGMAAGAVNGFFVAILRLQPIITTYATSFLFGGLALLILPSPGGGMPSAFTSFYRETRPLGIPLAFFIIALIMLAWYGIRQTRYGRYLFAVGGNADAAYQTGVPVNMVQFSTYVISGLMAAFGGIAITLLTGSGNAQIGDSLTLAAITAVVIGGTALSGGSGTIAGAIIGAIILSLLPNLISFANIETWWQTFLNAAIIVIALALPGFMNLLRRRRT